MKILGKIIVVVAILLITFVITFFVLKNNAIKSLILLTEKEANEAKSAFDNILELKGSSIMAYAVDYTYWDEMVNCITSDDLEWADQNIKESLPTYRADAAWVYAPDFTLVYAVNNLESEELQAVPLSEEKLKRLFAENRLCHFFVYANNGLMEIRAATVHPTDDPERKTPPKGYFFVGRLWNDEYISELSNLTGGVISITGAGEEETLAGHPSEDKDSTINFSRTLYDWDNKPVASINIWIESATMIEARRGFNKIFPPFLIFEISSFLLILTAILLWVYKPLTLITAALKTGNIAHIAALIETKDEFGNVAQLVNNFFKQKNELVSEISERKKAEEQKRKHLFELEVFYKASIGREERILELKKEIERLKTESGRKQGEKA